MQTLAQVKDLTLEYLKKLEKNHITQGFVIDLLTACQRHLRGSDMDEAVKAIRNGVPIGSMAPREDTIPVNVVNQTDFPDEKKMIPTTEKIAVPDTVEEKPVKDATSEMGIIDLYSVCNTVEKLKDKFAKPGDAKKALADLGITSKGSYEDHLKALKAKWDEINGLNE